VALGPTVRKMLDSSPALVGWLTDTYRGFFVDLDAVVDAIPMDASVGSFLNIGTGDGELVNSLVARYPNLRLTTTDISDQQGWLLKPEVRQTVTVETRTPSDIAEDGFGGSFDIVFMSDVMHHVPVEDRETVMQAAWQAVSPGGKLVIKDIEDRGIKAVLSLWSDKYLTGDRHTVLINEMTLTSLITQVRPNSYVESTGLIRRNFPNYLVVATDTSVV
jgi:2-polyprenyl-3-methyl-5-hydroxy-6-metoxy-1,4-benzoquinol methylase